MIVIVYLKLPQAQVVTKEGQYRTSSKELVLTGTGREPTFRSWTFIGAEMRMPPYIQQAISDLNHRRKSMHPHDPNTSWT